MHKEFEFKGFQISLWEEWSQFLNVRRFNWCDFQFVNFSFEYDRHLGGLELQIVLFGFGLWIRVPIKTDKSEEEWKELNKRMSEIKSGTHAWGLENELKDFKSKSEFDRKMHKILTLYRTRKNARERAKDYIVPDNPKVKRIYFYESK